MSVGWQREAACRDVDPEVFFPVGDEDAGVNAAQVVAATAVCGRCLVRRECLAFALAAGEDVGVWGGLTAPARRELRRPRAGASGEQAAGQVSETASESASESMREWGA